VATADYRPWHAGKSRYRRKAPWVFPLSWSKVVVAGAAAAALAAAGFTPTVDAGTPSCSPAGPDLRYVVLFPEGTPRNDAAAEIADSCGTAVAYYPEIAVAVVRSADPDIVRRLGPDRAYSAQSEALHNGARLRHEPDRINADDSRVPGEDRTAEQWDMRMISADSAHGVSEGSRDVLVGVLDSGIDPDHPDLAHAVDLAHSAGCLTGAPDPSEQAWRPTTSPHGTHVAGTIAAADDGRGITGVAPGVRLASVKVVDDDGYIYPESAVCGLLWAARNHMAVTNNSYYVDPWLFTCEHTRGQHVVYEAVRRAVDYAARAGVLNVVAATNSGMDLGATRTDTSSPDNAGPEYRQKRQIGGDCTVLPGGLPGTVTASAVGMDAVKAGYSAYGLGRIDVTAPGGDRGQGGGRDDACVLSTVPGGYNRMCGTSMAAPHVTGVAALLASANPGASPDQLRGMLERSARPLPCPADYDLTGVGLQDAFCSGYPQFNGFYGHGMVNALTAVAPPPLGGRSLIG
jgi:subtilisin family serine protease